MGWILTSTPIAFSTPAKVNKTLLLKSKIVSICSTVKNCHRIRKLRFCFCVFLVSFFHVGIQSLTCNA